MSDGLYMYCIIRGGQSRQFATPGIGESGDCVYTIPFENLAAVVSDSPVVEYEGNRRNMMAHTSVLEEVMQEHTILPVRFSTVASNSEAIQEKVLKRRSQEINSLLQQIEGRKELGLKVFWQQEAIFQDILEENPDIRQLRDRLAGIPPQQSYYDRAHLGEMVQNAVIKKCKEDSETILARLCPLACEHKSSPTVTERMLLNAAFLVDKNREAEFNQAIQQLDEEMGSRLTFKYVDQVPPYNFVHIAINWNE